MVRPSHRREMARQVVAERAVMTWDELDLVQFVRVRAVRKSAFSANSAHGNFLELGVRGVIAHHFLLIQCTETVTFSAEVTICIFIRQSKYLHFSIFFVQ